MVSMKTVIFCGGKGTRLREKTVSIPKPMVTIGNKPILWHIMSHYAKYGYKDFILPLGYKGDVIKNYFYNYKTHQSDFNVNLGSGAVSFHQDSGSIDWNVCMSSTGENTLKGARLSRISEWIDTEHFMVTYGDGVSNIDIKGLVDFHIQSGKIGTFSGVRMPSRFGSVSVDDTGHVLSWQEKPLLTDYINCGFFVFKREFLDYLSPEASCDLEKEPLEKLAAEGQLSMYRHEGFWQCMDTLRDSIKLNEMWESGNAPWCI